MSGYRYASTMGERYAMPIYFPSLEEARKHERMCKRLLEGLPGQDSMQIETQNTCTACDYTDNGRCDCECHSQWVKVEGGKR